LLMPLICRARRRTFSARDGLTALVIAILLSGVSCGGGSNTEAKAQPGTPPGIYSLTLTATSASGSTTLEHTFNLTLKVQ
jgi:hypothetical protein